MDLQMLILALGQAQESGETIFFSDTTEIVIGEKIPSKLKKDPTARMTIVDDVIRFLNEKTGKRYSSKAAANQKLILARINEGATLEDFKTVIENKVRSWKGDHYWDKYLRPSTLFQASKFEGYLNERSQKTEEQSGFDELQNLMETKRQ